MILAKYDNCYKIDHGVPHLIKFSGGRSSAYMLHKIIEVNKGMPENAVVVFNNTSKEHIETYKFINRIEKEWKVKIYYIEYDPDKRYVITDYENCKKNGEVFDAMLKKDNFVPNTFIRSCTRNLKIRVTKRFARDYFNKKAYIDVIGFRYDEMNRVNRFKGDFIAPMADAKITKDDVNNFWKQNKDMDLKLGYYKNKHTLYGNCKLCFMKGTKQLMHEMHGLMKEGKEDEIKWWIDIENKSKDVQIKHGYYYEDLYKLVKKAESEDILKNYIDDKDDVSMPCSCTD